MCRFRDLWHFIPRLTSRTVTWIAADCGGCSRCVTGDCHHAADRPSPGDQGRWRTLWRTSQTWLRDGICGWNRWCRMSIQPSRPRRLSWTLQDVGRCLRPPDEHQLRPLGGSWWFWCVHFTFVLFARYWNCFVCSAEQLTGNNNIELRSCVFSLVQSGFVTNLIFVLEKKDFGWALCFCVSN
jgi:hypothetical protein